MSRVTLPTTRFTVDEFVRLVEADAFGTTRVELLNGRIYFMTQREAHMLAISKGGRALEKIRRSSDWVVSQGTLRLDRFSAPDPDLMLLPVPEGTASHLWPLPVLLIEISDTTYRKDSGIKLRKYAHAGIADFWIENLREKRIEVYRNPQNPTGKLKDCRFESVTFYRCGETIALLERRDVSLAVEDLLP
jgi:Uma2 family endonuclease